MGWISVKDALPKKNQVIVYCGNHILRSCTGRYCGKKDPMPSAPVWLCWEDVTHWMPLPKIPKDPL